MNITTTSAIIHNDGAPSEMWPQLQDVVIGNSEDDDVPWHDLMDAEEPVWDAIDPPVPIPSAHCSSSSGMDALYPTKKRESLDATETWLSEDDDHNMMDLDAPTELEREITITLRDHDGDEDMILADEFLNEPVSTSLADWNPAKANTLLNDEHASSINNNSNINNNNSNKSFDEYDEDLDDDDDAMMNLILNDAASLHELLNSASSSPASRRPSMSSSAAAVAPDQQSLSSSSVSSKSFHDLFEERRAQLAMSMQKTRSSRNRCFLQEHVKTRASLANVLRDIERSSRVVARHVVQYWEEQRRLELDQKLASVSEEPIKKEDLEQSPQPESAVPSQPRMQLDSGTPSFTVIQEQPKQEEQKSSAEETKPSA